MHPLDTLDRRELVRGQGGLGMCNVTKCCTEVCPAYIKITDNAITPMKERVIDQRYDPLRLLMPQWRRRPGRDGAPPPRKEGRRRRGRVRPPDGN